MSSRKSPSGGGHQTMDIMSLDLLATSSEQSSPLPRTPHHRKPLVLPAYPFRLFTFFLLLSTTSSLLPSIIIDSAQLSSQFSTQPLVTSDLHFLLAFSFPPLSYSPLAITCFLFVIPPSSLSPLSYSLLTLTCFLFSSHLPNFSPLLLTSYFRVLPLRHFTFLLVLPSPTHFLLSRASSSHSTFLLVLPSPTHFLLSRASSSHPLFLLVLPSPTHFLLSRASSSHPIFLLVLSSPTHPLLSRASSL